jgi:16S rRNA (uracil1498-N3)-methyltransferase
MTRRRWIADEVSGDQAFLTGNNAEHLERVLRARIGQQFEIATSKGVRLGEIVAIQPERVTFALQENLDTALIAGLRIHLYLSIFKFDRMEWAVEKCTELGIASLRPVIAQRTEKHLAAAAEKRVERWRRIAHEAAQQSRRAEVPEVLAAQKLNDAVARAPGERILLAENESHVLLRDLIKEEGDLSLAIGPEGGWTEKELESFLQHEWRSASLGNTILRAETAAVAAVAVTACGNRRVEC